MTKPAYICLSDLRGFHRLANEATVGLTDLVEAMHHTIVRTPGVLGKSPTGRTSGITGLVYKSVRGVTRLVGASVDDLLGLLAPLIAKKASSHEPEPLLAPGGQPNVILSELDLTESTSGGTFDCVFLPQNFPQNPFLRFGRSHFLQTLLRTNDSRYCWLKL